MEQDAATIALRSGAPRAARGLGITAKIFLSTAAIVALAIGGAIAWSSLRANQIMEQGVRRAFASTEGVFESIQASRYDKLKRLNAFVAGDPTLFAVITDTDEVTLKDDLRRRQESLGSDFVFVTDSTGSLLARTDERGESGEDLSGWPLIKAALGGTQAFGLLAEQGRLYNAVALPIGFDGGELIGVLVSGYAIDDSVADEMRRSTGTEVAFVSMEGGKPRLVAATLKSPEEVAPLVSFALAGFASGGTEPQQVAIAGQSFLGRVTALTTPSGERAGGLVVLRSIAAELETYRRLSASLVWIGLAALLFAFLVSFLIARRISEPLRGLVRVAESVREGDYAVRVPASGSDEVGALANAIRAMVRELKDKAELERFVAELAAKPAPAVRTEEAPTVALGTGSSPSTPLPPAGPGGAGAEPRPGQLFASRYEILEVIGQGGMGKVYKARDRELDEIVALKTIRKDLIGGDPAALERFKQEIKLARKATHKNIMRTFDFGDASGVQYLTMEYVQGYTLRDLVRRQKQLPLGIALRIARQICTGLFAAHDAGIIHRDVKSHNILILPNGDVRVMDFGIARPKEATGLTSVGMVVGTPEFMAPEQALGKDADQRSDVYAAGMVFYELFTGSLPFTGTSPLEVAMKHVNEKPRAPREINPALLPSLEAIILKMVEKEPARRFPTFAEVYAALSKVSVPAPAAAA